MNLALPAVLIILGMLPGIIFFHSYFSGRFQHQLAGISATSEAALYIFFAIPLGLCSIRVCEWFGLQFDYDLVSRLLVGTPGQESVGRLSHHLRDSGRVSAVAYLSTLLGSLVIGNLIRRFVWATRLDVRIPFLRMKHEWFYTITGRLATQPRGVVPSVDLLVDHPEGSGLYQGWITHIEVNKDGGLDQLILEGARRGKGRGSDFEWVGIPGDRFVVTGKCVHSINLRYILLEEDLGPLDRWAQQKVRIKVLVRSFFLQEP